MWSSTWKMPKSRKYIHNSWSSGYLRSERQSQCRQYLWFGPFPAENSLFVYASWCLAAVISALMNIVSRTTYSVDWSRFGASLRRSVTESVESSTASRGWILPPTIRPRRWQQSRTINCFVNRFVSHSPRKLFSFRTILEEAKPDRMAFLERHSLAGSSAQQLLIDVIGVGNSRSRRQLNPQLKLIDNSMKFGN